MIGEFAHKTEESHVIPALPGWSMVHFWVDENEKIELYHDIVIAWSIVSVYEKCNFGLEISATYSTPITADNFLPTNNYYVLKDPNGRIFSPENQDFENESQLIEYFKDLHKQKETRRSSKA